MLTHSTPGKGAAVRHGMLMGEGDYLFICDADLAMPIEEIAKFLPPALKRGAYDIAIASREAPGAELAQQLQAGAVGEVDVGDDHRRGPLLDLLGEAWVDVCEFTLEEMPLIDRVVGNWYTSTHPDSHFRHRLVVARALPEGGRCSLLNRELTVRDRSGRAEVTTLETPEALLEVLEARFALRFPPGTRFECAGLDWP